MFTDRQIDDAMEAGREWLNRNGWGSTPDDKLAELIRNILEAVEDAQPKK